MIFKYTTYKNTNIEIKLPETGSVGVFLSGGINSALLLYLICKSVKENDLPISISPITGEYLHQPVNLRFSQRSKETVEELCEQKLGLHFCYPIPSHYSDYEIENGTGINHFYANDFAAHFGLKKLFFAHSKERFLFDPSRPNFVDPKQEALGEFPFSKIDLAEVADLYSSQGIIKTLLPKTYSCELGLHESNYYRDSCTTLLNQTNYCRRCAEKIEAFSPYL